MEPSYLGVNILSRSDARTEMELRLLIVRDRLCDQYLSFHVVSLFLISSLFDVLPYWFISRCFLGLDPTRI